MVRKDRFLARTGLLQKGEQLSARGRGQRRAGLVLVRRWTGTGRDSVLQGSSDLKEHRQRTPPAGEMRAVRAMRVLKCMSC